MISADDSSCWITSKTRFLVNVHPLLACLGLLILAGSTVAHAADEIAPTLSDPTLPSIEAKTYHTTVVRRSRSERVYLMSNHDLTEGIPEVGKILLFKRDDQPAMAFRVLKNYPEEGHYAAKRVKRYGSAQILQPAEWFIALEKVSDVPPPPPTAQDKADMKELEQPPVSPVAAPSLAPPPPPVPSPSPFPSPSLAPSATPTADTQTTDIRNPSPPEASPTPENTNTNPPPPLPEQLDQGDETEEQLGISVEETGPLDTDWQWLAMEFAFFRNSGGQAGTVKYYTGGGVRYGVTLGKNLFLKKEQVQDSWVAELGIFYYKILNLVTENDSYGVVPLEASLRYNVAFSESFSIFGYLGIVENFVSATPGSSPDAQTSLTGAQPAFGFGSLFQIGPGWALKTELGYDMIGIGLVLKF